MQLKIKENYNHHQNNTLLKQFYKKAENKISDSLATNDYLINNNKLPLFVLSQVQINHYNLIEILTFQLSKQVSLKFFDFNEHQITILLLKTRNILDQLQKLCCSIKITFLFDIFLKIMTCLSTIITNNCSKVYKRQKYDKQKKQNDKQVKNQVNKEEKQNKQSEIRLKKQIVENKVIKKRNKLRGIIIYNQDYTRHIQNRNLLCMRQTIEQQRDKMNFWKQLQENIEQSYVPSLKDVSQQHSTVVNWWYQIEDQNTSSINMKNTIDMVSQIYQNQKFLTLDSMKKFITKVTRLYEQKIIKLQEVIKTQKQKNSKSLQQQVIKKRQNTKDTGVQIYQYKLKPTYLKEVTQIKQKLKIAEQTIKNMEQIIGRLNNQLVETQRVALMCKIKLQQKEKKYECLQKNTRQLQKNSHQLQKQIQKQKNSNHDKDIYINEREIKQIIINCQSILSGNKIDSQSDRQIKDVHVNYLQNLLKKMQNILHQSNKKSKRSLYQEIHPRSEKIITNRQLASLNISQIKQQNNIKRSNTSFKKKKTIKFNLNQKINNRSNKENNFSNSKSMSMHSSTKNVSLRSLLNNNKHDEIKIQLDSSFVLEDNNNIQNSCVLNFPITNKGDENQRGRKQQFDKEISQKINKVSSEYILNQKNAVNYLNSPKKCQSYYIQSNHDDIIKNQTQRKSKMIQQAINQQINKIRLRQSEQNLLHKGRNQKRIQRIPIGSLPINQKNNSRYYMMYGPDQQKQQYENEYPFKNLSKIEEQKTQKEIRKLQLQKKLKRISNTHIIRNQMKQDQSCKQIQNQLIKCTNTSYNTIKNTEKSKTVRKYQDLNKSYASPLKRTQRQNKKALIEKLRKKYQNRNIYQPKVLNLDMNSSGGLKQLL